MTRCEHVLGSASPFLFYPLAKLANKEVVAQRSTHARRSGVLCQERTAPSAFSFILNASQRRFRICGEIRSDLGEALPLSQADYWECSALPG